MQPWFIATKRFGPGDGQAWIKYVKWSGLEQLEELVSLDSTLCDTVLPNIKGEYWPYIVNEDYMGHFFVDLKFLLTETSHIEEKNVLCVFLNPPMDPVAPTDILPFEFLGYDLVETEGGISALSNCGGFPDVFSNSELSRRGLLSSNVRALEVQALLRDRYPEEAHANCHVWAVFRSK